MTIKHSTCPPSFQFHSARTCTVRRGGGGTPRRVGTTGLGVGEGLWLDAPSSEGASARPRACSDRAIIAESLVAGNFAIMSLASA
jgi:hypothetical protein